MPAAIAEHSAIEWYMVGVSTNSSRLVVWIKALASKVRPANPDILKWVLHRRIIKYAALTEHKASWPWTKKEVTLTQMQDVSALDGILSDNH